MCANLLSTFINHCWKTALQPPANFSSVHGAAQTAHDRPIMNRCLHRIEHQKCKYSVERCVTSSTQAEPVQAVKSGIAYFPSISCTTSWRRSRYFIRDPLVIKHTHPVGMCLLTVGIFESATRGHLRKYL